MPAAMMVRVASLRQWAVVASLLAVPATACNDEPLVVRLVSVEGSGGAGNAGNAGNAGSAGEGAITGGSSSGADGGAADAGSDASDAGVQDAAPDGMPLEAGADAADANPRLPPLCLRLDNAQSTAVDLVPSYFGALYEDCRVAGLVENPVLHEWGNRLLRWTLDLWGCNEGSPPMGFELVDAQTNATASSADIALLIDLYLERTDRLVDLSSGEAAQLRSDLELLAETASAMPGDDHLNSRCDDGSGGAGGVAGAGNEAGADGIGGAGGSAGSGAMK